MMPEPISVTPPSAPNALALWIDRVADQFEDIWANGDCPDVVEFLARWDVCGEVRRRLIYELVPIDVEYRNAERADARTLEDYLPDFPELADYKAPPPLTDAVAPTHLVRFKCPQCGDPIRALPADSRLVECPSCGKSCRLDPLGSPLLTDGKDPFPLGKFRLLELLGQGAFGAVYKALDTELDRIVAIKIPRAGALAADRERERFLVEARNAGQMRHENIVRIHEIANIESMTFIVSDYIDGKTLTDHVEHEGVSQREATVIAYKIADALYHAHTQGVIHRDIKPSNILIDKAGQPHITDFGLARREESDLTVTADRQVIGSPAYMSPEQARGISRQADGRSDIYSLGVVLYELLTGCRPFEGKSIAAIVHQVINEQPKSPRAIDRRISRDLETICVKAMEKELYCRYSSAFEMSEDLHSVLHNQPLVYGRPVTNRDRVWRWCRRHPLRSLTIAAGLIVTCLLFFSWHRAPGTLVLNAEPAGARVVIGEQTHIATTAQLELQLPNGVHSVEVIHPGYAPAIHDVLVRRHKVKSLTIKLARQQGLLNARCDPFGQFLINNVAYGSPLIRHRIGTGRYEIVAHADEHFETKQTVDLGMNELVSQYFHLEKGVIWKRHSTSIQSHFEVIPDANGDGQPDVFHNELGRMVIYSSLRGDADPLWQHAAPLSGQRSIIRCDTDIGTILIVGQHEKSIADAPSNMHVFAVRAKGTPEILWNKRFPTRRSYSTADGVALALLPDLDGNGAAEVVLAGRDGHAFVRDVISGEAVDDFALHHGEFARPGIATASSADLGSISREPNSRAKIDDDSRFELLFVTPRPGQASFKIGSIRTTTGQTGWSKEQRDTRNVMFVDVDSDGVLDVLCWNQRSWTVLSSKDGQPMFQGEFPAGYLLAEGTQPSLLDIDQDGMLELLLPPRKNGQFQAIALTGRATRWQPPPGIKPTQPKTLNRHLLTLGPLVIVVSDHELTALERKSGRRVWGLPGDVLGILLGDWDGDGENEIFVSLADRGIVCLAANGKPRWVLRLRTQVIPVRLLPDVDGDAFAELLVFDHGGYVGLVRGPRHLWSVPALRPLQASPVIIDADGSANRAVVQAGSFGDGHFLRCFDLKTGNTRWSSNTHFPSEVAPASGDWDGDGQVDLVGIAVPPGHNKERLVAIRGHDGATIDARSLSFAGDTLLGSAYSLATLADLDGDQRLDFSTLRWEASDIIAVYGDPQKLSARRTTGQHNWSGAAAADLDGDGLADVIAPSSDGYVYALKGSTWSTLWRVPVKGGCGAPPTPISLKANETLIALVGKLGVLHVLDGSTGRKLWSQGTEQTLAVSGQPAWGGIRRRLLLAPHGSRGLAAYDLQRRKRVWQAKRWGVSSTPRIADMDGDGRSEVVIATDDGQIVVLDLASGSLLWQASVSTKPMRAAPALVDANGDGILDIVTTITTSEGFRLTVISGDSTRAARNRHR